MSIEDAINIAIRAHRAQVDKGGNPYILHPLRVMQRMHDETSRIVAVLHDVIEDAGINLSDLSEFGPEVVAAVDALTRRRGETYDAYIDRVSQNAIAKRVKLADLEDNYDLSRIPKPTEIDLERSKKYLYAIKALCK